MKKLLALVMCFLILSPMTVFAAENSKRCQNDEGGLFLKSYNIKAEQLDPSIRTVGSIIRFIMPSMNEGFFRLANFFLDNIGLPDLTRNINREEIYLPREDGGQLRLCVYTPKEPKENVPGLLWIHGGGFALGCPEQDFAFIQSFVDSSNCVVVAPDYTNSTTAPYPSAFDDCYASLLWLKENGEKYGMRNDKIFVGGNSAGGGLCAAVTLKARDTGDVNIAFQMPLYPMLDDRMTTNSMQGNDAPIWNEKSNRNAWKLYLGDNFGTDNVSKYAAPARETDYSGLPPTLSFIGTVDPFLDEATIYMESLKKAGVKTEFLTLDGCFHGFDLLSYSAVAKKAKAFLMEGFDYAVKNYSAPQG